MPLNPLEIQRRLLLWALLPCSVWATTPESVLVAQVQPLTRIEAEQERLRALIKARPPAYEDRFQEDAATAAQDATSLESTLTPPPGLRTWLLESQIGWTRQTQSESPDRGSTEMGLRLEGRRETLNHGEWMLQADTRYRSNQGTDVASNPYYLPARSQWGERLTLRNLGFPVTPFVFADTAVGDITSEVTDGLRRGQRLSLGATTVRGAGLHLFAQDYDIRLGSGQRGNLAGGPFPGFQFSRGNLAWAGFTRRALGQGYIGIQVNEATDVPWSFSSGATDRVPSSRTRSVATTLGYGHVLQDDGDKTVRLTWLSSQSELDTGERPLANGVFLEGALRLGNFRHDAGLYSAQPKLRFADQWIADGAKGVYWRTDHQANRLNWGLGFDHARQPSTLAGDYDRTSVNANWQWRLDRRSVWGGYLQHSLQHTGNALSGARSSYASAFYQDQWFRGMDSRLRLNLRRNQAVVNNAPSASGEELEWEQDWLPRRLSVQSAVLRTTVGWARDHSNDQVQTYPTAGVTWQDWLASNWSVNANLRYTSRSGNLSTSRGLSGAVRTEYRVTRNWMLGGSLLLNQAVVTVDNGQSQLNAVNISRSSDKTALIFLRYEEQQGQPFGFAMRGSQGAGSGRVSGVVFFDANRDGEQQADEAGVPRVEVFLNERERTFTDERGRFEFAQVPTGVQRVSLSLESVPLPWGGGRHSVGVVDVPLRGTSSVQLGVVKTVE